MGPKHSAKRGQVKGLGQASKISIVERVVTSHWPARSVQEVSATEVPILLSTYPKPGGGKQSRERIGCLESIAEAGGLPVTCRSDIRLEIKSLRITNDAIGRESSTNGLTTLLTYHYLLRMTDRCGRANPLEAQHQRPPYPEVLPSIEGVSGR